MPPEIVFLSFTSIVSITALGFGLMRSISKHLERKHQQSEAVRLPTDVEDILGAQTETIDELRVRLADLEERVDFTERLLANRDRERLPREN